MLLRVPLGGAGGAEGGGMCYAIQVLMRCARGEMAVLRSNALETTVPARPVPVRGAPYASSEDK